MLGIPNLVKNSTSFETTTLEVIFLKGMASGYLVVVSMIVSKYSLPNLVLGNGPTQSIITFLKGSFTTGIGASGAGLMF